MNDEKYNYREAVTADCTEWLDEYMPNMTTDELMDHWDEIYDQLWTSDSVTGNGSGSYYCSSWKAESALCHNWDLLAEAMEEFGGRLNVLEDPEGADVMIRCYLLAGCLNTAMTLR